MATEQELEQVLKDHVSLVRFYAHRWSAGLPDGLDVDDLMQVGNLALLECLDRYREGGPGNFRTFAGWRVNGAMGDEVRRMRWLPRHIDSERLVKLIDARRAKALPVTAEALAEVTGVPLDKIHQWELRMVQARRRHLSLTAPDPGSAGGDQIMFESQGHPDIDIEDDRQDTEALVIERERVRLLHAAVDLLPDRLRTVITLHYFEEMTNAAIGKVLMVTESRISQMMKQAEAMLREAVAVIDLAEPLPFTVVNARPVRLRECPQCGNLFVSGPVTRDYCRIGCKRAAGLRAV